jgi:hypothetical protein
MPFASGLSELASLPAHRVKLPGGWRASRQTFRDGVERIAAQQVELRQEGGLIQVTTLTQGLSLEEGGYHWAASFACGTTKSCWAGTPPPKAPSGQRERCTSCSTRTG